MRARRTCFGISTLPQHNCEAARQHTQPQRQWLRRGACAAHTRRGPSSSQHGTLEHTLAGAQHTLLSAHARTLGNSALALGRHNAPHVFHPTTGRHTSGSRRLQALPLTMPTERAGTPWRAMAEDTFPVPDSTWRTALRKHTPGWPRARRTRCTGNRTHRPIHNAHNQAVRRGVCHVCGLPNSTPCG